MDTIIIIREVLLTTGFIFSSLAYIFDNPDLYTNTALIINFILFLILFNLRKKFLDKKIFTGIFYYASLITFGIIFRSIAGEGFNHYDLLLIVIVYSYAIFRA